jgi:DNA-binding transcriptional LysR family regulator
MIDKLVFLLALAREEHFGRAADACGVTQPTLSAGIKQLETTLGVLLVERGTRFVGFTPEGLRVLDWGRRIVGDARAMRDELQARRDGLTGHLRLAAVPTALPIIAKLTTPLRDLHPEVTFTVRSCTSGEVLGLLENLEIDAGVTYVGNEPLGRVRHVPLYDERYALVVAADDPLATRTSVGWADVGGARLCLLTPDMQNRRIIDRRLLQAGQEPHPVLESNSLMVLVSQVRTGRWASVLPTLMAEALLGDAMGPDAPIRAVPIQESEASPVIGLVYPLREPLSPLTAALVTEARRLSESKSATATG